MCRCPDGIFHSRFEVILRDGQVFYPDIFAHSALLLHGALSGQWARAGQSVSACERDLTQVIWPLQKNKVRKISVTEKISVFLLSCDPSFSSGRESSAAKAIHVM